MGLYTQTPPTAPSYQATIMSSNKCLFRRDTLGLQRVRWKRANQKPLTLTNNVILHIRTVHFQTLGSMGRSVSPYNTPGDSHTNHRERRQGHGGVSPEGLAVTGRDRRMAHVSVQPIGPVRNLSLRREIIIQKPQSLESELLFVHTPVDQATRYIPTWVCR